MLADVIRRLFRANNNVSGDDYGLLFRADLQTTLRPQKANGSNAPTFTRATTAYVEDFEGLLKPALSGEARFKGARRVYNYLAITSTPSENISAAAWTKGTGCTASDATTLVYAGGGSSGGQRLTCSGVGGRTGSFRASFEARWVVAPAGTNNVRVRCSSSGGYTTIALTTSWQRLAADVETLSSTSLFFDLSSASGNNDTFTLQIRGMQLEDVTGQSNQNPSEYVSVGVLSAPYHGAGVDGVKYFPTENGNTVSSNVVTEATGAPITGSDYFADASGPYGYLSEGQRTNLCLQSQTFDNASWVKSSVTVTADSTVAPDGTTTADTISETSAGASQLLMQTAGLTAATHTFSFWAKSGTKSDANFRAFGSVSGSLNQNFTFTSTLTRYTVTLDLSTLSGTIYFGFDNQAGAGASAASQATGTYILWGMQAELASFASSYIPTTTASVTRNADVLTYARAGNLNDTAGSAYAEATIGNISSSVAKPIIDAYNISGSAPIYLTTGNKLALFDGAAREFGSAQTLPITSPAKLATSWAGSSCSGFKDGAQVGTAQAFDGDLSSNTAIGIGIEPGTPNTVNLFGTIRNVRIYGRALSDAQLQAMTT